MKAMQRSKNFWIRYNKVEARMIVRELNFHQHKVIKDMVWHLNNYINGKAVKNTNDYKN